MQPLVLRDAARLVLRLVEIVSELHEFRAERCDRRVLIGRVTARHVDGRPQAGARRGEGDRLAVIAAGGGDDATHLRMGGAQPIKINEPTPNLERAGRRVILVLHPHSAAGAAGEFRPRVLRGRRHDGVHQRGRTLELGRIEGDRGGLHGGSPGARARA